jgi:pyridoxal phosphate enzyme (YggS family)
METLISRYLNIITNLNSIASRKGLSAPTLVAVSKYQAVEQMRILADFLISKGELAFFGESYIQEYRAKQKLLPSHRSHLIGRLQRNKAREAVELFDVIESVHSLPLAEALQREAERCNKIQDIFLQINVSEEEGKAGFYITDLPAVLKEVLSFTALKLCGVMTITRYYKNREEVRPDFAKMKNLADIIQEKHPSLTKPFQISMGMSADYDIATEEGATFVRVGSALFGERY